MGTALCIGAIVVILSTSSIGLFNGTRAASAPALYPSGPGPWSGTPGSPQVSASMAGGGSTPTAASPAAASTFNPPCAQITASTCIRPCSADTPNVVPSGVNHTSNVEPFYTENIYLCLYSEKDLIWAPSGVPLTGPHAPVTLNATGILWNGDPWMCECDHSQYTGINNRNYQVDTSLSGTNATYPYVYDLTIWNRSNGSSGQQLWYSGEQVTWWVYIVNYTNTTGYTGQLSHTFSYRIAGAWAFSPWPNAVQYAGANASTGDLTIHWSPRIPNWNDTVNVSISVTAADIANNTAIGMATLVVERFQGALLVGNVVRTPFPIQSYINSTGVQIQGNETAETTIPSYLTQVAGDTLVFWVVAQDNAANENDTIQLPPESFTVNGNGSFSADVFCDDLRVITNPQSVANSSLNGCSYQTGIPPTVNPGENVTVTVESKSTSTSLFSVLIVYTLSYAPLSEVSSAILTLYRVNSTTFRGQIPGMPVNATLGFTVFAFDYTHHLDESAPYGYAIPSLTDYVAALPVNDTFFYVYIYDNGSQSYVDGAQVQIRGPTPAFNTVSTTRFGIAYPNRTGNNFLPLLLAANQAYNITVTSQAIESTNGHILSVVVNAPNAMTVHTTLERGGNYIVVQEGNSIFFWVNGTVPSTVFSPSTGPGGGGMQIAAFLALVGAAAMAFALYRWFDQIQKRRKAEERRVTL